MRRWFWTFVLLAVAAAVLLVAAGRSDADTKWRNEGRYLNWSGPHTGVASLYFSQTSTTLQGTDQGYSVTKITLYNDSSVEAAVTLLAVGTNANNSPFPTYTTQSVNVLPYDFATIENRWGLKGLVTVTASATGGTGLYIMGQN